MSDDPHPRAWLNYAAYQIRRHCEVTLYNHAHAMPYFYFMAEVDIDDGFVHDFVAEVMSLR